MSNPLSGPFASAHRAGNNREAALAAVAAGADLLETDIWLHHGRLELRHQQTAGPLPILWEKWTIAPGWKPRYQLHDLLADTPAHVLPFLDFKGNAMDLGPTVLAELHRYAPDRTIAVCGRNYPQLETVADAPNVIPFYSVGETEEWPIAQEYIAASTRPALSLIAGMATEERIDWIKSLGGTVVCWDVHNTREIRQLYDRGVDGFTTDHLSLLAYIRQLRRRLQHEQNGAGPDATNRP